MNIAWPEGKSSGFSFTFDDGDLSHVNYVAPTLNKYHINGTFFLSGIDKYTQYKIGKFKELHSIGHELGSHTVRHPNLLNITLDSAYKEISGAHDSIKRIFALDSIQSFAYPYCKYNSSLIGIVEKFHTFARTCQNYFPTDLVPEKVPMCSMPQKGDGSIVKISSSCVNPSLQNFLQNPMENYDYTSMGLPYSKSTLQEDQFEEVKTYLTQLEAKIFAYSDLNVFMGHKVLPFDDIEPNEFLKTYSQESLDSLVRGVLEFQNRKLLHIATFGELMEYRQWIQNSSIQIHELYTNRYLVDIQLSTEKAYQKPVFFHFRFSNHLIENVHMQDLMDRIEVSSNKVKSKTFEIIEAPNSQTTILSIPIEDTKEQVSIEFF